MSTDLKNTKNWCTKKIEKFKSSDKEKYVCIALVIITVLIMLITTLYGVMHPLLTGLYLTSWLLLVVVGRKKRRMMQYSLIISSITLTYSILIPIHFSYSFGPVLTVILFPPPPLYFWSFMVSPLYGFTNFYNGSIVILVVLIMILMAWFILSLLFSKKNKIQT